MRQMCRLDRIIQALGRLCQPPDSSGAAEAIGDALADGVGLVVDAMGVNREQDSDAVPSAPGDLGGR